MVFLFIFLEFGQPYTKAILDQIDFFRSALPEELDRFKIEAKNKMVKLTFFKLLSNKKILTIINSKYKKVENINADIFEKYFSSFRCNF